MRKLICLILALSLCAVLAACDSEGPTISGAVTEEEVKAAIETYLEPQIQAYREAFGLEDLTVDLQLKKCEITQPHRNSDGDIYFNGYASCIVRDVLISPTISQRLASGDFTDELLKQLSAIKFEYETIEADVFTVHLYSAFLYPTFADEAGTEYTVSDGILLKGNIIAYIAEGTQMEYEAKVGDDIRYVVPAHSGSSGASGSTGSLKGTKCAVCNGSGYVKYYYGDSDLQAYLDGYDPYTVGKCTSCKGKGYD